MSSPQENNRRLLQRALKLPQVSDGMIQGKSVRLILKKEAPAEDIRRAEGMPEMTVNDTTPRFEDAFIDLLGGAGTRSLRSARSSIPLTARRVKRSLRPKI